MEKTYVFRVLVDTTEEDDVFRDIEIRTSQRFLDLHECIQECFGFDNSQMASFYLSNEDWERGQEIALMDVGMGDSVLIMADTSLETLVEKPGQRILYVFDFMLMWTFFVELVHIGQAREEQNYPDVILSIGDAPDQYSKTPEDLFGAMGSFELDGDDELPGSDDEAIDPEDHSEEV